MVKNKLFLLSVGVLFSLLVIPSFVDAAYTPLANGLGNLDTENLGNFFNNLFQIALTIGAVLAVLIIAVSGLQYMTTEAASGKGSSRERMQQAVLGLLMLLSVWLFFNEINPDILNLDFVLSPVNITVAKPSESGAPSEQNTTGATLVAPDVLPEYTDETWTRMSIGETCSSVKGEGWEAVRESRCPGVSPFGTDTRDCCALNPNYISNAHANGTIYPPTDRRNLPSGSWCYTLPNSSNNCFSSQNDCSAAVKSDPSNPLGGCGEIR
ncbi:hypothetical protein JXR01_02650 [Candidatus Kaiserbacteria bacterium]|nr:MAG: hypothetical protein JXR01_02650 [Candidatus Kaiserbacteria bacterium]